MWKIFPKLKREMVNKYEDTVKARAKERQGTRNDLTSEIQEEPEQTSAENYAEVKNDVKRATDELGRLAGVSASTYEHATAVLENAPAPVVEAARNAERIKQKSRIYKSV